MDFRFTEHGGHMPAWLILEAGSCTLGGEVGLSHTVSLSCAPDGLGDTGVGESIEPSFQVPGTHTPIEALFLDTCKLSEQVYRRWGPKCSLGWLATLQKE